jgi:hypothetical protein
MKINFKQSLRNLNILLWFLYFCHVLMLCIRYQRNIKCQAVKVLYSKIISYFYPYLTIFNPGSHTSVSHNPCIHTKWQVVRLSNICCPVNSNIKGVGKKDGLDIRIIKIWCPLKKETPSFFLQNPVVVQKRCHDIELVTNWLAGQGAYTYMQYELTK